MPVANPFAQTASGKGLAPMDAPPGTLLAYATAPGNVAADGDASIGNGLYTQYLVRELRTEAKIEDVFKRVRWHVRKESQGRQVPWESTSLEDDFYFDPNAQNARQPQWDQAFASEKAEWDLIRDSKRPEDFYAYLQKHPSGLMAEQAQFRLDQLQKAQVRAQPGVDGIRPLASGADRYAVGDVLRYERVDGFTKIGTAFALRVTAADHNRVEFNGGGVVADQMGGMLRNRFGVKDPALLVAPADIAVGKQWRSAFTNTPARAAATANFWEARVVGLEEVTVPAGVFRAYRVEKHGEARPPSGATTFLTSIEWIDPQTMIAVRTDLLFRKEGKITEYSSDRLVSYERAPR